MQQQIDPNRLLQIIGEKETQLILMREYIAQLEKELEQKNQEDKS